MKKTPTHKTGFVWHEIYMWHDTSGFCGSDRANAYVQPESHYESPEAKRRIRNLLEVSGLLGHLHPVEAAAVSEEELLLVHSPEYVNGILAQRQRLGQVDDETPLGIASVDIAERAVGGAVAATTAVMSGDVNNAYALLRPPGHHAEPGRGMGFCVFSNAAIAGAYALKNLGAKRIAFVDWDVHHGNGTEACFYDNPNALTISLHQDDWFPRNSGFKEAIGQGQGAGTNINIPLMPGCGHGAYLYAFEQIVIPAVRAYAPDIIFVPCGFDASIEDPLGRMMLFEDSYKAMTERLMTVADEVCQGRLVFTHEGGYNPKTTPFLGLAVIETLAGAETGIQSPNLDLRRDVGFQALQDYQRQHIDQLLAYFQSIDNCPLETFAQTVERVNFEAHGAQKPEFTRSK